MDTALLAAIKNQMDKLGWDATKTMDNMGIPATDQIRYAQSQSLTVEVLKKPGIPVRVE